MVDERWTEGYIAGIIDAEGSFSILIKRQEDMKCKIRIQPVFTITQEKIEVLETVKDYFKCGRITRKPGQRHLYLYIVDSLKDLSTCFITKLKALNLIAKKKQQEFFTLLVTELAKTRYKRSDCCKIRSLAQKAYELSSLNSKSQRKRSLQELITLIPCDEAEEPPGDR